MITRSLLINEAHELQAKLNAVVKFMDSDQFALVSDEEKILLLQQEDAMRKYLAALRKRATYSKQ